MGKAQPSFDAPQFPILKVAIGGDLDVANDDTLFPVRLEVDDVLVYQPAQ